ncbi:arabinose efflux permease [Acetobacter indonesiensis NRIC 0313]|uniref:MFS transporter n=3 Tax=Acetobacter indonesiensis TaxID=104101 RepID=A0A252AND1_9PROT|nr:transcriptional regulator [Acetobacter indonesiensis]GAN63064.1 major facilitator superfamily transporter [Acetobacter indonesiensis]GBQ58613.1 arabinose efflux permease [Acetobacter indonesiensis NRIC 0313]GEN04791.1 MFS transporter [Acetobacter indonesiensis]
MMDTISQSVSEPNKTFDKQEGSWGAVLAMSLGAFALVASEFMPVSLLTPIAANLHISEGQAGQAISVSGAFAVLTSLFISSLTKGINRKTLLLSLIGMMIISGTVVSLAPTYIIFMLGRAMIGVVIGGFWSMSAATAMRLVEDHHVPRALAILNGGNALATVIAAPAGSFLGGLIGWRGAFFCVVPVAVIVFVWQLISLPSMPSERNRQSASVFALLTRPIVRVGMIAVSLFFMGQFTLFTYVRPFLEDVAHVDVRTLSLILLLMGISGFVGTVLIGSALKKSVYPVLISIPLLMALLAFGLLVLGKWIIVSAVILTIWGLFATSAPVGWWSWLARTLPRDAEAGGGLMVAVVQFAITLGATCGGILFDGIGYQATFAASAVVLLVAAWLAFATMRLAHSR